MESDPQNVGPRWGAGGGCFLFDDRAAGLEGFFEKEAFLPLEPRLGGDLGLLTGMGNSICMINDHKKIIAQMVCFSLGYNCSMHKQVS